MDCDICSRDFTTRRKPLCTSCAQATIYSARLRQVTALLCREKQHAHAEAVVRPGNDGVLAALPEDADWDKITAGVNKGTFERMRMELQAAELRIATITEKAEELRRQVSAYKDYAMQQRQRHAKQKEELEEAHKILVKTKSNDMEIMRSAIRKAQHREDKVRARTADARRLLCWEAAALGGLSRLKGKDGTYEYWLGGVQILDLRRLYQKLESTMDMHERTAIHMHDRVSTSLDNICRLVGSCCHYLSVRLPAEIVLPHKDFPHAVIMPEKSSYKAVDPPYPGISSSRSVSPAASSLVDGNGAVLPRPRLLHLDRPLHQLLQEDSKAFHLFLEGLMLLAWDVAWLCRTQGLENVNTFDEVCNIGKNLYQLFLTEHHIRPSISRNPSSATAGGLERINNAPRKGTRDFGSYSHGSSTHNLSGHEGANLVRGWRLASPARLVDKLKSYMLNEISGAEWDFLSGEEWDEEAEKETAAFGDGSIMTVAADGQASARANPARRVVIAEPK